MTDASARFRGAGPSALIVCGAPATGKSTFASHLARALTVSLLDLDTLTTPLFEFAGGEALVHADGGANRRSDVNAARYECLIDTASANLAVGNDVILVAPFTSERESPRAWDALVGSLGIGADNATLVWVDTPHEEAERRARARNSSRDASPFRTAARSSDPRAHLAPSVPHIRIDGLEPPDAQIASLLTLGIATPSTTAHSTAIDEPQEIPMIPTTVPSHLTTRERRGLAAISTDAGHILVVAADQRNGMKAAMQDAPGGASSISTAELAAAKADLVRHLGNRAPSILLDPEVALPGIVDDGTLLRGTALVIGMDASGFEEIDGLRYTRVVDGMTLRRVRELGGDVAKMLFYTRPDKQGPDSRVAEEIRAMVSDAAAQQILLIVELLTYQLEGESDDEYAERFPRLVADGAKLAVECGAKVLKIQYPGSAEACDEVDAVVQGVPWAVLSAGVDHATFLEQVAIAMTHGASGAMAGRAIWKDSLSLLPDARTRLLTDRAVPRLAELRAAVGG